MGDDLSEEAKETTRAQALVELVAPISRGELDSSLAKINSTMETMAATLSTLATRMGIDPNVQTVAQPVAPVVTDTLPETATMKKDDSGTSASNDIPIGGLPGRNGGGVKFTPPISYGPSPSMPHTNSLAHPPMLEKITFLIGNILCNLLSNMLLLNFGELLQKGFVLTSLST